MIDPATIPPRGNDRTMYRDGTMGRPAGGWIDGYDQTGRNGLAASAAARPYPVAVGMRRRARRDRGAGVRRGARTGRWRRRQPVLEGRPGRAGGLLSRD